MGEKGARSNAAASAVAEGLVADLAGLGDVTSRKMFGGVGIFRGGTMFALVDSAGRPFLRAGEDNRAMFEEAGSERHGRMPYYALPDDVRDDPARLRTWAEAAAAAADAAKS